jgi:hypothetical protein
MLSMTAYEFYSLFHPFSFFIAYVHFISFTYTSLYQLSFCSTFLLLYSRSLVSFFSTSLSPISLPLSLSYL